MNKIIEHYDTLIEENNDPVHDIQALKDHMNKWDGEVFIDELKLDKSKAVLEIGVGTGRLAIKVIPNCNHFTGIDISKKTIARANENTHDFQNKTLICGDFYTYEFDNKFDVIYSSLTFFHLKDKQKAIDKVTSLLVENGRFILSVSKDQSDELDYGTRRIPLFPDNPQNIKSYLNNANLNIINEIETEFAWIIVATNG